MSSDEWLRFGFEQGWVSPAVCATHDGIPLSDVEAEDEDNCVHIVRLYEDFNVKAAVEAAGGPAVWRASNRGWSVDGDN